RNLAKLLEPRLQRSDARFIGKLHQQVAVRLAGRRLADRLRLETGGLQQPPRGGAGDDGSRWQLDRNAVAIPLCAEDAAERLERHRRRSPPPATFPTRVCG